MTPTAMNHQENGAAPYPEGGPCLDDLINPQHPAFDLRKLSENLRLAIQERVESRLQAELRDDASFPVLRSLHHQLESLASSPYPAAFAHLADYISCGGLGNDPALPLASFITRGYRGTPYCQSLQEFNQEMWTLTAVHFFTRLHGFVARYTTQFLRQHPELRANERNGQASGFLQAVTGATITRAVGELVSAAAQAGAVGACSCEIRRYHAVTNVAATDAVIDPAPPTIPTPTSNPDRCPEPQAPMPTLLTHEPLTPGEQVRIARSAAVQTIQGKALSGQGRVIQVRPGEVKVLRDGLKSGQWYPAAVWEPYALRSPHEAFLGAIRERPSDYDRRRVYADFLEESGLLDLAAAYRWMAQHRKRPEYLSQPGVMRRWVWYHPHYQRSADPTQSRQLEVPEHAKLPAPLMFGERCWMKIRAAYFTEEEAVEALAAGLKGLRSIVG